MSPRGKRFDQTLAKKWATGPGIIVLCGRFEGIDERIFELFDIEEVSLGDFVMTGGEIAAQAMIDATVRLLPNVLGNPESALEESHSNGLLEYPQYTKPAEWRDQKIPEILLSGHHQNIANWRMDQAKIKTQKLRPDLWEIWNKAKLQK
jgi:tRNA (guanine37-N1)-methyltransferase